jgi:hypothetical protein
MKLDTITRIEQFLCDSLIASPLIPISVNVLRLADAIENEGVVNQTNNIVVRYTGSTSSIKKRIPLMYDETLRFELNFSSQNYLTSSGHDFATQLLTGAKITLSGASPSGANVQVSEPFYCTSSQFTGINSESQYTYTQVYSVMVEETLPYIALDPCVQRGDCSRIFPGRGVSTRLPLGGVVDEASGSIYVPWYPGQSEEVRDLTQPKGVRWSNETTQMGDWVFVCDPDTVFIDDPLGQPIYLLSNNSYTEDGRLVVTVWDAETKEPLKEVFYEDTGKKLARYAVELWRNTTTTGSESYGGISPGAIKDATFFQGMNSGDFAVVKGAFQILYTDPMDPDTKQRSLSGGTLIGVQPDVFIQTPKGRFYFVVRSPLGKGWLLEDGFELATINSLWKLGCLPCEANDDPRGLC